MQIFDAIIALRMGFTEVVGGNTGMAVLCAKLHQVIRNRFFDAHVHCVLPIEWNDPAKQQVPWVDQFLVPAGCWIDIGYSWGFGNGVIDDLKYITKVNPLRKCDLAISIDGIHRAPWFALFDNSKIDVPDTVRRVARCWQTKDKHLQGHALKVRDGTQILSEFRLDDVDHSEIDNDRRIHDWVTGLITAELERHL